MAPRKSKENTATAPALPGASLPVEETYTDRVLAPVLKPQISLRLTGATPPKPATVAIRQTFDGRQFTSGPPRLENLSPKWLDFQNMVIADDAESPERIEQKDGRPRIKKIATSPTGVLSLVEKNYDWSGTYYAHLGPIRPEYELLEPFTLYDVEVFVQQAIRRRVSLMFRNGYRITGQNQNKVRYIERRMNQIAYMMKKTWANFFREILTTLSLCSNCFILKLRQEDASGGTSNEKNGDRTPIAAYVMIPPHALFPYVDKGRIIKWRRYYNWSVKPYEDYPPEDVIHLSWDRKPSHIFGTPRLHAVKDDIYAIRRLEENIELLFMNFLFPLFHVKVGTKEAPSGYMPGGLSEIDHTRKLIETMPKEGALVTDERVDVEVIGAKADALDPAPLLSHYKKRIFTGLGVSPLDMGEGDTTNGSTADNVSQALKDSIKYDLDTFSDQFSMEVLRDLFSEANFDISVQESIADVKLDFIEVDMDNKIKEENHATNLYNSNGLTHSEYRQAIKRNPLDDEQKSDTHHEREIVGLAEKQAALNIKVAKATPPRAGAAPSRKGKGGKKGKSGRPASVEKKATPKKKVTQNATTPTNQHGTKTSPKRGDASETLYMKLYDAYEAAHLGEELDRWPQISARIFDEFQSSVNQSRGSSYTKHPSNAGHDRLKQIIGQTTDLDVLFDLTGQISVDEPASGDIDEPADSGDHSESEPRPEGSLGSGVSQSGLREDTDSE